MVVVHHLPPLRTGIVLGAAGMGISTGMVLRGKDSVRKRLALIMYCLLYTSDAADDLTLRTQNIQHSRLTYIPRANRNDIVAS